MMEPQELPVKQMRRRFGLKMIVIGAVGTMLSLGVCQLGFYLGRNIHDGAPNTLDALGGVGFLLSVGILIFGIVVAIVEAVLSTCSGDEQ